MKLLAFFLFLYLTVFQTDFVESGLILDNVKTGISNTRQKIGCGIQKFGGLISQNKQNANCGENKQDEKINEVDVHTENEEKGAVDQTKKAVEENTSEEAPEVNSPDETKSEEHQTPKLVEEKTTEKSAASNDTETETPKLAEEKTIEKSSSSNDTETVTVDDGRRLINVGLNCPDGEKPDGKGGCREEY